MSKKKKAPLKVPKSILATAKVLEITSNKLAAKFAMKLFITPMKFKLPRKEMNMELQSEQEYLDIESLDKKIRVYHYGTSDKKVLLVHGWSGRGTQLWAIAEELIKNGYSTVSFDAPAHGKSSGKTSNMLEFIASIQELNKKYGPFEYAIGHSLGAMSVLNSIKQGLTVKKAIIIGSGDKIEDILSDFISKLGMNIATRKKMIALFENKFDAKINDYSAYVAAKEVHIPVLVIHDKDDKDVPATASQHIHEHLEKSELMITEGLGHRKILGNGEVIKRTIQFITQ
ncbi:MAG: alpha/beta hydrolase [Flavobacterium sp. MedPE-SWcel]|uniref:alpha/beta fold hydrolase n=1 Tax=uncultured Flavobacterium sp. TaxID=165435 RepID=UPI0009103AF0|nr:alpha/beta hydrolase [uncultured Flavobacterium sp.]OIQ22486.1 MAG: alpha/beta hydrolase [Flavobacterium sp. MedPE-SWcel]